MKKAISQTPPTQWANDNKHQSEKVNLICFLQLYEFSTVVSVQEGALHDEVRG